MTYQMPLKEQEKLLRIAIGNSRYSIDRLNQLPQSKDLDLAIQMLKDAITDIQRHAKKSKIAIHEGMPT